MKEMTKYKSNEQKTKQILELEKQIYNLTMERDYSHFSSINRRPSFEKWLSNKVVK